ncbi:MULTISPECIES: hypothetical protein [Bacteria]|uniref:hypothetical protein n=1 Tax=Bacteria TaxID=2 RepID=UPI003F3E2F20
MIEKLTNKNFYDKNKNVFSSIGLFDIPYIENNLVKGGCIRKLFFQRKRFSRGDYSIYNLEKEIERNLILKFVRSKYLNYSSLSFLPIEKQKIIIDNIEFNQNEFLISDTHIFLFKIITNVSDFKKVETIPLINDFPILLTLAQKYSKKYVTIIYKNLYGKSEISHCLVIKDSILYVNDNETNLDYMNIATGIYKAIDKLNNHIYHNDTPARTECEKCEKCYWLSFCKYI